ncbi:MAG: glycogen synthase [Clostridia bacterium]|nr:glycogen synthase [Clostridia bacterium]
MKILYVTGEAAPFSASGGLGDVMGALPGEVKKASPQSQIGVILPLYGSLSPVHRRSLKKITEFTFAYGWRQAYCGVFSAVFHDVTYYFVDNEQYFKRDTLYGQYDDGERFAYFCRAVLEFILRENLVPDVLHANDWQTALSVVYPKTRYKGNPAFARMKTVFTIHNIEYQGKYDLGIMGDIFDIADGDRNVMEYDGCLNLMKAAVVCADRVTTVSPTYAVEIKEPYFAYGLSPVIRMQGDKLSGIINGIDVEAFSSLQTDIPFPFAPSDFVKGKAANKAFLQKTLGLPEKPDVPLIVMVTRLTEGKGIDLLLRVFDEMMSMNIQFALLGTGDKKYETLLDHLAKRYPDKARVLLKFDRGLSKLMYASGDLFLMPSKTEPCGLAQMIACRYGTLPIVHGVGGLSDSIIPYDLPKANGFVLRNFNAHDMLFRIKDALLLYENPAAFRVLCENALKTDFSWSVSAPKYVALYSSLSAR